MTEKAQAKPGIGDPAESRVLPAGASEQDAPQPVGSDCPAREPARGPYSSRPPLRPRGTAPQPVPPAE